MAAGQTAAPALSVVVTVALVRAFASLPGEEISMKYIRLIDNIVVEILPEENPELPGVPITERYSSIFLETCIGTSNETAVEVHDVYDPETETFSAPPLPPEPTLAEIAEQKAAEATAAAEVAARLKAEADEAAALAAETETTI